MIWYVIRRLGQALIVMVIVSIVVFTILHLLPGGLVRAQLGRYATSISVHQLTVQEGLNKPIVVQYGIWAWRTIHGNLGFSYKLNESVAWLLGQYLPRDLLLIGVSSLLTIAMAVPLGLWQGYRRNRADDHAFSAVMLIFYSMPTFLLGVCLIVALNIWTNLLPPTATNFGAGIGTDVLVLALPVITLALSNVSEFSRYMRASTVDSLLSDHVRTARAKGAGPGRVLLRHVLRNSLGSTITLVGLTLPYVLSGSLIIEALFNYPGMGLLFWNAAVQRDFPVIIGVVLVVTLATVVGNLIADLGYAALDPRIRDR